MNNIKILLINCGNECETALETALRGETSSANIASANGEDDALEAMVSESFHVCLIRSSENNRKATLEICSSAREAGIRVPLVVLMDIASPDAERAFTDAGAMAAMPWDGTEESMLRNVVRLAVSLRTTEQRLRKSNDKLVQDMVTLQDERERAQSLNEQYVAMAEELEQTRVELEKLNQEKNKFFSIIAHDLRSPFTSLLGYTSLIEQMGDKLSSEEIKTYSAHINDGATRVFKLLENLLEWARIQMDKVETVKSSFNVADVAAQTIEVLEPVAEDKQIELILDTGDVYAFADANQIDTIIRNLVNNAIKFTNEGGKITITATAKNDVAEISVTDTGLGMSEKMTGKLFNLSENVTTAGTKGEAGTGLGLLMCKELVERSGGEISVKSTEGVGSTFSFTIPTRDINEEKKRA